MDSRGFTPTKGTLVGKPEGSVVRAKASGRVINIGDEITVSDGDLLVTIDEKPMPLARLAIGITKMPRAHVPPAVKVSL